jgi:hypothetical protein
MFQRPHCIETADDLRDELNIILRVLWDDIAEVGIKNVDFAEIRIDFKNGLNQTKIYKHTTEGEKHGNSITTEQNEGKN